MAHSRASVSETTQPSELDHAVGREVRLDPLLDERAQVTRVDRVVERVQATRPARPLDGLHERRGRSLGWARGEEPSRPTTRALSGRRNRSLTRWARVRSVATPGPVMISQRSRTRDQRNEERRRDDQEVAPAEPAAPLPGPGPWAHPNASFR